MRVVSEPGARLQMTRSEILGFRRRVGHLDRRLPIGEQSLQKAAWAGLTDSMPRAALLSIHARVEGTLPDTWEDPSLVQVWGPRFSAYVVAARDRAVFTVGRWPDSPKRQQLAVDLADRLEELLQGSSMSYSQAGKALGIGPNYLRYASPTGRVLIRWDGARRPTIRMAPPPDIEPGEARQELVRRYLHVFGPGTPRGFGSWAGVPEKRANVEFEALRGSMTPVGTPIGTAWILSEDEEGFTKGSEVSTGARLLPSGDTYYLLQGEDRNLLVPEQRLRTTLWTSRVWPGAVLLDGEIAGIWRRTQHRVTIESWRRLTSEERGRVEAEAGTLPLPEVSRAVVVEWGD
jgi:Winged helix DNA-binding domain